MRLPLTAAFGPPGDRSCYETKVRRRLSQKRHPKRPWPVPLAEPGSPGVFGRVFWSRRRRRWGCVELKTGPAGAFRRGTAATTSRRTYATSMSPRCRAPRAVPATSYRRLR